MKQLITGFTQAVIVWSSVRNLQFEGIQEPIGKNRTSAHEPSQFLPDVIIEIIIQRRQWVGKLGFY